MRLIHTSTLRPHNFYEQSIPPYAVLSHTWTDEEITLQELEQPSKHSQLGYAKVSTCCALALKEGWQYVWIDTCCIDKTSSAELSEAINSMYQWYKNAEVCYVYLVDVDWDPAISSDYGGFCRSRWFTRGWTLQELLAPASVVFYDRCWEEIGTRLSLQTQISTATCIPVNNLKEPARASVAAKMSWAAQRKTTRIEDIAYCLLGLFGVNMPLLYGEGSKAFMRLQEMILLNTSDESLFAWEWKNYSFGKIGILAHSPEVFSDSGDIISINDPRLYRRPSVVTNKGLEIDIHHNLRLRDLDQESSSIANYWKMIHYDPRMGFSKVLLLSCARKGFENYPLYLDLITVGNNVYARSSPSRLRSCSIENTPGSSSFECKRCYIEISNMPIISRALEEQPQFNLFVAFSSLDRGFSLLREVNTAELKVQQHIDKRKRGDVEGWQFLNFISGVLGFGNKRGEHFILEVRKADRHANFKVYVPNGLKERNERSQLNPPATQAFETIAETDRQPHVCLQAGSVLSIESRRRLLEGRVFSVIHVDVPSHGQPNQPVEQT
ncbi:MAG: hypothetical protein L6R41_000716 [Letrouitia leprolyta]|nr:MAG: hypothetical protein L6R41_000716 [Letrouitia leprolyta]